MSQVSDSTTVVPIVDSKEFKLRKTFTNKFSWNVSTKQGKFRRIFICKRQTFECNNVESLHKFNIFSRIFLHISNFADHRCHWTWSEIVNKRSNAGWSKLHKISLTVAINSNSKLWNNQKIYWFFWALQRQQRFRMHLRKASKSRRKTLKEWNSWNFFSLCCFLNVDALINILWENFLYFRFDLKTYSFPMVGRQKCETHATFA